MRKLSFTFIIFLFALSHVLLAGKDTKKEQLLKLIEDRSFTIENFQMADAQQNQIFLGAPHNALFISGDDFVFQTSFNGLEIAGMPQENGLGGMTLVGKILNYQINNADKKGILNINVLASTQTYGHITFNVSFYNDFTARTIVRGFDGLKMFMLGNVKEGNMVGFEAGPSF